MNEESLPLFASAFASAALRILRRTSLRAAFGRLLSSVRLRRRARGAAALEDRALRSRAAAVIREYADAHATLFERAERLRERAERLEKGGTPSESARNRAERARREVEAGLAVLRASFAASAGRRRAFDREVERRYPAFRLSDGSS